MPKNYVSPNNSQNVKKIYDAISFRPRRDERMRERIVIAAKKNNKSINSYMVDIMRRELLADGISIEVVENTVNEEQEQNEEE